MEKSTTVILSGDSNSNSKAKLKLNASEKQDLFNHIEEMEEQCGNSKLSFSADKFRHGKVNMTLPDQSDKKFIQKLLANKTFGQWVDNPPTKAATGSAGDEFQEFSLSSNQAFIKSFVSPNSPYKSALLFYATGTGKTCSAVQIAESFKDLPSYKSINVLMSSTLHEGFVKQIFDVTKYNVKSGRFSQCTGETYFPSSEMKNVKTAAQKAKIQKFVEKHIKSFYDMYGYIKFSKIIQAIKDKYVDGDDETLYCRELKRRFSNSVFIIDEVHNIRTEVGSANVKATIDMMIDVLKYANNVKLVLMTATPMFNSVQEIFWLIDFVRANEGKKLLTAAEKQGMFTAEGTISPKASKIVTDFASKYVSFMRGEKPYVFPTRIETVDDPRNRGRVLNKKDYPMNDIKGVPIPEEKQIKYLNLFKSDMSGFQLRVYSASEKITSFEDETLDLDQDSGQGPENIEEDIDDDDIEKNSSLQRNLQMSNVVFVKKTDIPTLDSSVKQESFKSFYRESGFKKIFNVNIPRSNFNEMTVEYNSNEEIFASKSIENYSCKIKTIIDKVLSSTGIVLIYTQFMWSGIYPLAVALEHIGITRYNKKPFLTNTDLPKARGKYAILTSKISSKDKNEIIRIAKSKANTHGDEIKILLVTQVATEGIDLKNVREIHIMEPWFNSNRIVQVIGRGIRNNSHKDLPPAHRNVTIYQHVAVIPTSNRETIDFRMYRISENKQKLISKVERLLKTFSIDCNLHKNTSYYTDPSLQESMMTSQGSMLTDFYIGDKDFSQLCDFTKCDYKCVPNIEDNLIGSKRNLEYPETTNHETMYAMHKISLLFKTKLSFTYNQLAKLYVETYTTIADKELRYFKRALFKMLKDNYPIVLDGSKGTIIYRSNKYVFQPNAIDDHTLLVQERMQKPKKRVTHVDMRRAHGNSKTAINIPNHEQRNEDSAAIHVELIEKQRKKQGKGKVNEEVIEGEVGASTSNGNGNGNEFLNEFNEKIDKLYSIVKKAEPKAEIDMNYITWMAYNMLSKIDIKKVFTIFFDHDTLNDNDNDSISRLKSFVKSGIDKSIILEEGGHNVKTIWNPYTSEFICKDNNMVISCPTNLQLMYMKSIESASQKRNVKTLVGFGSHKKKYEFKIFNTIDPKSDATGSICEFSSNEFKKNLIVDIIMKFQEDSLAIGKTKEIIFPREVLKKSTKNTLCVLYDYLLRRHGNEKYLSSIESKIHSLS